MSVEPGIVDTNVLIYALDADAPQHAAARALLEAARADPTATLFVTSQILCEFFFHRDQFAPRPQSAQR
jgi:predicted nucleic acid-binding protein